MDDTVWLRATARTAQRAEDRGSTPAKARLAQCEFLFSSFRQSGIAENVYAERQIAWIRNTVVAFPRSLVRLRLTVPGMLMLAGIGAHAGEPDVAAQTDGPRADPAELPKVLVQPPEPRFVAPTSRDRIGRIWAPVLIDGKGPYRLVLDTGANRSAVTERTAQALGSVAMAKTAAQVTGFTGSAIVPMIHVDSLEIGDFVLGPANLPVLPDVFGGADGVLSLSAMSHERIYADFTHDRLEIAPSRRQLPPPGFQVLPLRIVDGLPTINVRIGGVLTRAIVDTGAQRSVGNLALREALAKGPSPDAAREDITGVTLDTQSGDRLPSPQIELGTVSVRGLSIVFGDMYVFRQWNLTRQPTLAIGMDLLGSFDVVIIDYALRELQVRLR